MFWKRNKKAKSTSYLCAECGEEHLDWPALAYLAPVYYDELNEEQKDTMAQINSDFCIIHHGDQVDRFIRVNLVQKVLGAEQDLEYGLWVSLSEKSYNDYQANFNSEDHEAEYFGWLSNSIPPYSSTLSVPVTVVANRGNDRPYVFPHRSHDHPFINDFYDGIGFQDAQKRVCNALKK